MLNSHQRAQLRALANDIDTIVHVGKGGVTENIIKQMNDALEAREIVKGKVLENAMLTSREVAETLAGACGADVVQSIGSKYVLYRRSKTLDKEKRIKLADR